MVGMEIEDKVPHFYMNDGEAFHRYALGWKLHSG